MVEVNIVADSKAEASRCFAVKLTLVAELVNLVNNLLVNILISSLVKDLV